MEMWFSFAATMSTRSGQHAVQNKPVADISFFSVAAVRDRGAKPAPWARSPTSRRSATGGVMRVRKMVTGINQHTLKPGLRTEGAEDSNVSNQNQDVTGVRRTGRARRFGGPLMRASTRAGGKRGWRMERTRSAEGRKEEGRMAGFHQPRGSPWAMM